MAKVLYQYDIKTPGPDTNVEDMIANIEKNLPEEYVLQKPVETKKMFFGIKAAVCQFVAPEDEGVQDKLEDFLNELDTTGEFELSFTTRL